MRPPPGHEGEVDARVGSTELGGYISVRDVQPRDYNYFGSTFEAPLSGVTAVEGGGMKLEFRFGENAENDEVSLYYTEEDATLWWGSYREDYVMNDDYKDSLPTRE